MLLINRTAKAISTYSADAFGVASALFELGGLTVIHDASGCNSTYTTHDEPRWFDRESMVFVSAISEMEALMGDDEKLFGDIVSAAQELKPRFIAIAGTPIPMMTGFDYDAAAKLLEGRTSIPTFAFATNGMHDYSVGISMALAALARHYPIPTEKTAAPSCNILGLTPLDFSLNGSTQSVRTFMEEAGYEVLSTWAMNTTLEQMARAGAATVNLVVSAAGLAAAQVLRERFGTPYVCGLPIGPAERQRLVENLARVAKGGVPIAQIHSGADAKLAILGEPVQSKALAACIFAETSRSVRYLCPLECDDALLAAGDLRVVGENEIEAALQGCEVVIADPLYQPAVPKTARFLRLPHEAFSGRMFTKENPNLIKNYDAIVKEL